MTAINYNNIINLLIKISYKRYIKPKNYFIIKNNLYLFFDNHIIYIFYFEI